MILAVDQSTSSCSAALLDNDVTVTQRQWTEGPARNQQLFPELDALFKEASISPASITLFAVGLGPGSFSGLRVSICAVQGMALPLGKPVIGIASGEAIALQTMQETNADTVHVLGDARRNHLWTVSCRRHEDRLSVTNPCRLIRPDAVHDIFQQPGIVATPDYTRIAELLSMHDTTGTRYIGRSVIPTAASIGSLAWASRSNAVPLNCPLSPIYMHPPVASPKTYSSSIT